MPHLLTHGLQKDRALSEQAGRFIQPALLIEELGGALSGPVADGVQRRLRAQHQPGLRLEKALQIIHLVTGRLVRGDQGLQFLNPRL